MKYEICPGWKALHKAGYFHWIVQKITSYIWHVPNKTNFFWNISFNLRNLRNLWLLDAWYTLSQNKVVCLIDNVYPSFQKYCKSGWHQPVVRLPRDPFGVWVQIFLKNEYVKIFTTLATNAVNWVFDFPTLSPFLLTLSDSIFPLSLHVPILSPFPHSRNPIGRLPQLVPACSTYMCVRIRTYRQAILEPPFQMFRFSAGI